MENSTGALPCTVGRGLEWDPQLQQQRACVDTGALNLHGTGVGGLVNLLWSWMHPWQGGPPICRPPPISLGKEMGWSVWDEKEQVVNLQTP